MVASIPNDFTITGRVVDSDAAHSHGGYLVELWDRDLFCDDKLGSVMTNADGTFSLQFDRAQFGSELFERKPDIYALVFEGPQLVASTRDHASSNTDSATTDVLIYVPKPASTEPKQSTVTQASSTPATEPGQTAAQISPAQFGQRFIDEVLTANLIADQALRLLPNRHFRESQEMSFGPVKVTATFDALVSSPGAEQVSPQHFLISFPVDLQVRIRGQIGPCEVEERFAVNTRVPVQLSLQIFDTLGLYLDAKSVTPDSIDVAIEREAWTEFSRGEVDKGVRKGLADKFNETLLTSGHTRSIDVLALVHDYLERQNATAKSE